MARPGRTAVTALVAALLALPATPSHAQDAAGTARSALVRATESTTVYLGRNVRAGDVTIAAGGATVVAWRSSVDEDAALWAAVRSASGTWRRPVRLDRFRTTLRSYQGTYHYDVPTLLARPDGQVVLVWVGAEKSTSTARWVPGHGWSQPVRVSARGERTSNPAAVLSGSGEVVYAWAALAHSRESVGGTTCHHDQGCTFARVGAWQDGTWVRHTMGGSRFRRPGTHVQTVVDEGGVTAVWPGTGKQYGALFSNSGVLGGSWGSQESFGYFDSSHVARLLPEPAGRVQLVSQDGAEGVRSRTRALDGEWSAPSPVNGVSLLGAAASDASGNTVAAGWKGYAVQLVGEDRWRARDWPAWDNALPGDVDVTPDGLAVIVADRGADGRLIRVVGDLTTGTWSRAEPLWSRVGVSPVGDRVAVGTDGTASFSWMAYQRRTETRPARRRLAVKTVQVTRPGLSQATRAGSGSTR